LLIIKKNELNPGIFEAQIQHPQFNCAVWTMPKPDKMVISPEAGYPGLPIDDAVPEYGKAKLFYAEVIQPRTDFVITDEVRCRIKTPPPTPRPRARQRTNDQMLIVTVHLVENLCCSSARMASTRRWSLASLVRRSLFLILPDRGDRYSAAGHNATITSVQSSDSRCLPSGGKLYNVWSTTPMGLKEFGLGVAMYFATLQLLCVTFFCCGLMQAQTMSYYKSEAYSDGQVS
jgi:hypothetical protein